VAYQARLESVCSRKATVGSNPTLSALFEPYPLYPLPLSKRKGESVLRGGEVDKNLNLACCEMVEIVLFSTKTAKSRKVSLSERVLTTLKQYSNIPMSVDVFK
jgi:hypothetical protein